MIMRTCREDGVLLQPARPLTPIDRWFIENVFGDGDDHVGDGVNVDPDRMNGPTIQETSMPVDGLGMAMVLLAVQTPEAHSIQCRDLYDCVPDDAYVKYSYVLKENTVSDLHYARFDSKHPLTIPKTSRKNLGLIYITPLIGANHEWAIFGELQKVYDHHHCHHHHTPIAITNAIVITVCYHHHHHRDHHSSHHHPLTGGAALYEANLFSDD